MSPGRAYALFALVCLIFSTTWLAIRIGLDDFRPLGSAGLRFLVAFPILLAWARARKLAWPRAARDWVIPLGLSLSMFTVPFALIYFAELTVPSGLAAVHFAAHAIFVALLAHFVLRDEPLTSARVAGILIGFAGVIVVFWERRSGHHTWLVWGHLFRGETLGPWLFLGTVLVVGGVWLASRVDLKAAPVDAPAASAAAGGD